MSGRLERRYRRLLRAYPAHYRAARGDELVDTYLDTVGPDRRWPDLRDAADVLAGGARARLRAREASGLPGGVSIAAVLALAAGSILSTVWLLGIELASPPAHHRAGHAFGPFRTLAGVAWTAWLGAAALFALRPGRWCRWLVGVAVVLIAAARPVGMAVTGAWEPYQMWGNPSVPSLVALVPHLALGFLALAVPTRPGRVVRWMPLLAALVPLGVSGGWGSGWTYATLAPSVFARVATLLLVAAVAVAIHLLVRRDARAAWVLPAVLPPLVLLAVDPIIGFGVRLSHGDPLAVPIWFERSTVSVVLTVLTLGLLSLAITVSGHRGRHHAAATDRG
ncbi:hypothetical protein [Cryptosporangium aurantiacum]|uniref:Uncharacterized protein n=1 Tax=Cryptosporangium aurantiacum TaxID=134849 RepID=A0A1M7RKN0_9ACTN|nr:hypothetical protein [Cryptosporangium aurantiacum]SHN46711.1 hypothetical protein SAMN05443668_11794 [Cryptosporangium aurantiacum]